MCCLHWKRVDRHGDPTVVNAGRKFTDAQRVKLRARYVRGESIRQLAESYGVGRTTVWRALRP